ncbi:C2 and GRAM domain-containing protein [Zostera marina]|uniref:C2 and GRAM domain-containing protein n=1 Tax=Zostera marina TaxID=29655 RepID=A0A0K9PR41_ZOSMR|nr:C2 and GRAM domain-containing protein [Zostera marina]
MKLTVHLIEAQNLMTIPNTSPSPDLYIMLQLGRYAFKSKVVPKTLLNPQFDEKFYFFIDDPSEDLVIFVLDDDNCCTDEFKGMVRFPVSDVFEAESKSLEPAWYPLSTKRKGKNKGEIRFSLSITMKKSLSEFNVIQKSDFDVDRSIEVINDHRSILTPPLKTSSGISLEIDDSSKANDMGTEEKPNQTKFVERIVQIFRGKDGELNNNSSTPPVPIPVEVLDKETFENKQEDTSISNLDNTSFEETLREIELKDQGDENPQNLPGGVLLEQAYIISPTNLNMHLFSPESSFLPGLVERQGSTNLQQEPWIIDANGKLNREVTYIQAATKLIKSVKVTQEQIYMKADGQSYAILSIVSTPDVPYGSCFKTEILVCITPGPELPSEEETSNLIISWRINFIQSTLMRGMIENGARQGLKESYSQFSEILSQTVKPVDLKDLGANKEQILASLMIEKESDWSLASRFLGNFTIISTIFIGIYIFVHIVLSNDGILQGLEFTGLDLPDSIEEVVICGILVLQLERVLKMIRLFLKARKQKGTDHGIKAQGVGWLLTIALIEGDSLAAAKSATSSDPYVVFTCNGKTKTSSIKFQTSDPHWNEIFEFDAMDDPPSVMSVHVYDFDGSFHQVTTLGHAEINFVKSNLSELADVWVSLQGKLAQACQSKLHLRVFLDNTHGDEVAKEYLIKMEKEVGKKLSLRSPQTNLTFQKMFCLPTEEFLVNDFSCYLKRKMPLQGRLFLSPRIIGFNANLFGHKTKFYFLWEDIEEIQIIPPSLSSVGSPSLMIILRYGKGGDAKHGAKSQDSEGRLKFQFQSIIMALWKARSLSPDQKEQIVEEESEAKILLHECSCDGVLLIMDEGNMSEVYSSSVGVSVDLLMELFSGGLLDRKVMEKVGCSDYNFTNWDPIRSDDDIHQRNINYKLNLNNGGEVTSTQQKSQLDEKNGWLVEEVMTLQGISYGECFNVHIRYQIQDIPTRNNACNVQVYLGIQWLKKTTKNQKRITKSITSNLTDRLQDMIRHAEQLITGKSKEISKT